MNIDITQWEQRLDQDLGTVFATLEELFTEAASSPDIAGSIIERSLSKFEDQVGQYSQTLLPRMAQDILDPSTMPELEDITATVAAIVDIGDQTWVQPLAIVEHTRTGQLFIDPRFRISDMPSESFCVELAVTEAGLVATGPADYHRLQDRVDPSHFRPLAAFRITARD